MGELEVADALAELERTRDRVLDGASISPGDAVLDLGAGTGLLALGAVTRVGEDGDVYALDPSVDALAELRRAADAPQLWYLIGDAEVLPLPDACVDVAVTRSVLIYLAAVEQAVGELRRVVRPGGRVSFFIERDPMSQLDSPELAAALERVGFVDVRVETEDVRDPWHVTEESVDARLDAVGAWLTARLP